MQSRSWKAVENVIICYQGENEQGVVDEKLARGQEELAQIPGVLTVEIGRTIDSNGHYSYCWLGKLANDKVLENFKANLDYVNYAA